MEEFNSGEILDPETTIKVILLLLTSTHGDGDFPKAAEECVNYLHSKDLLFDHIDYSVFGLGDKRFEFFCNAAIKFDILLKESGASRLLQVCKSS